MSNKQKALIEKLSEELDVNIDWYRCRSMQEASKTIDKLLKIKQKAKIPEQLHLI